MEHVNQKTNPHACQHNTEPRGMWQGRTHTTRARTIVEIGFSTSWEFVGYIRPGKRAELIRQCVAEYAATHGRTPANPEPRYNGTRAVPDWRHTEFRIHIRPDFTARAASKFYVSAVDHDETCYV